MPTRRHQLALCTDLGAGLAAAPPHVELIPAGPVVTGRDGRSWTFTPADANTVVAEFAARNAALPIDWEHASQHRAPVGEEAPAAAWIESLEVRDGALWGAVNWTERGGAQVASREYRYLSPVFDFDPATGRIARLVSAGLTNLPNLHLQALNQEHSMSRSTVLVAAITGALGLAADATDDAVATAINQLQKDRDSAQALNTEKTPSLERYVPRADYDALQTRATNAEQALKTKADADHKAAVDSAVGEALKAGKITPATEGYHRASCTDAEGLERFRAFVGAAPVIGGESGLDGKKVESTAMNAEQIADKARTYIAEQAKAGNVVSTTVAVRHVTQGA